MKALILNSGLGHRMGVLTSEHPKGMTEISPSDTILSRQLRLLDDVGVTEVVMTTGDFDSVLVNYCHSFRLPLHYLFDRTHSDVLLQAELSYDETPCELHPPVLHGDDWREGIQKPIREEVVNTLAKYGGNL